jgi:hypothetical protein
MLTKKIANFSDDLLNTVRGILGEAKKHDKDCECEKCEAEDEMKEGAMPTADEPTEANKKTAQKIRDMMAKEKKPVKEDAEQLDEISADMAHRYLKGKRERDYDISPDGKSSKLKKPQSFDKMNKDMKSTVRALKTIEKAKKANEDVEHTNCGTPECCGQCDTAEQIDEVSKATLGRYINKAKDSIDTASYRQGHKEAHGSSSKPLEKKLTKRHKGISTAVSKLTKEEAEQIDELSKGTIGRYINKAATKMGSQGVTAGLKIAADEKSSKNFKDMGKREKGIKLAVNKLTKEEQDFVDSLNDEMFEGMDNDMPKGLEDRSPRGRARNAMGRAIAKKERNLARARKEMNKEEVEITEARGRPKKAGAKDFTIHPKTKEKLMHNNPADMARIERLQKNKVLEKPKVEAGQHIMNQLRKAKTSMTGGTTINFTHGDSKHVSGTHAARLLDKYADMKPNEKEDFQKKIGHSHEQLMKHV